MAGHPHARGRRPRGAHSAIALAMAVLLPSLLLPPEARPSPPPFGAGDWVVTGSERLEGSSLVLAGDLIVENGGSLVLSNSTLQVLCTRQSPHEIRVRSGGELRVLAGSVIGAFDATDDAFSRPGFWAEEGSTVDFQDSFFASVGVPYLEIGSTRFGGVCVNTSTATIRNCTFTGNRLGLSIVDASVTIEGCTFTQDNWGLVLYRSNSLVVNSSFHGDFDGAVVYRSSAEFRNCRFWDNANGLMVDGSTCAVLDCDFTANVRSGVRCHPEQGLFPLPFASELSVEDCRFRMNGLGVTGTWYYTDEGGNFYPLFHDLYLTNSDFEDNSVAGILWDRQVPGYKKVPNGSRWTVTGSARAVNDTLELRAAVTVDAGAELLLSRSSLRFNLSEPGEQGLELRGTLRLESGSTLGASFPSCPFGLVSRAGSRLHLNDSLLRDCGWDLSFPESSGPYLDGAELRVVNSTISHCPAALQLHLVKGALIENSSVRGNFTGMDLWASSAQLLNSTLETEQLALSLNQSSLLRSVNSTFLKENVLFVDPDSRLNLSWHLEVLALWADGRPVEGAEIAVMDAGGAEVARGITGGDGLLRSLELQEASRGRDAMTWHTPHSINCSRGVLWNLTSVRVDRSRTAEVRLEDRGPPAISILSPRDGIHLNTGLVTFQGTVRDDTSIARGELVLDGTKRHVLFDSPGEGVAELAWNLTVALLDGPHEAEVLARDHSGNAASAWTRFAVDTLPPRIRISSPADGFLTSSPEMGVNGSVEPGSRVLLDGREVSSQGGTFQGTVQLQEGENEIVASAFDAAGNFDQSSIRVTLDTRPPRLDLLSPPEGFVTPDPVVEVTGGMEEGAAVAINGRRVVLPGQGSTFWTILFLKPGTNQITVEAFDDAGNRNQTIRRVVLDTAPPPLKVLFPPDGYITGRPTLTLMMSTEAGARFSLWNLSTVVPGPAGTTVHFNLTVELAEGANDLRVRVADDAGNPAQATVRVVLDTLPPELSVAWPPTPFRTENGSVTVVGTTSPDSRLWAGNEEVAVGWSGEFSFEWKLSAGNNSLVLRSEDRAGNQREVTLAAFRSPPRGDLGVKGGGPDWPYTAFVVILACLAAGEGCWIRRRSLSGKKGGHR